MAIAPEALEAEEGAAAASAPRAVPAPSRSSQRGSGTPLAVYSTVSTPSAAAGTLTKLIWAVALGLIVLEIASEATGQYWDFRLPASGSLTKQPYQPLYGGSSASAALPGILGTTPGLKLNPGTGGQ